MKHRLTFEDPAKRSDAWAAVGFALIVLAVVGMLALLVVNCMGCTSALAAARSTTAATGELVDRAEPVLASVDQGAQIACLDGNPADADAARACVATVRRTFGPAWVAYRRVRAAWLAAAAAVEAAEAADRAGRAPDMVSVVAAIDALRAAETAFAQAAAAVEGASR